MAKRKITTIDDSKSATKPTKKEIFRWEEAYSELKPRTASALRDARLKPEQLAKMADGEILTLEGVGPSALEEIRTHYPAGLAETKSQTQAKSDASVTKTETATEQPEKTAPVDHPKTRYPRTRVGRSSTYQSQKAKLKVEIYPISTAVKMLREITYSVHKTVELHLNTTDKGVRGEVSLPHSVGKETRVAIFTPELANKVKAGKIDFDILLARPADMSAIAPLAKILGPKGLMPNPKSKTIIADPEKRKAELVSGAILTYRTEPKAPIMHLSIGNLDQKDKQLIENIEALLNSIGMIKITSAYLKSTMSPSIKLDLTKLD